MIDYYPYVEILKDYQDFRIRRGEGAGNFGSYALSHIAIDRLVEAMMPKIIEKVKEELKNDKT